MGRKTKAQLALEAQEEIKIVQQDEAYEALDPERQEKLDAMAAIRKEWGDDVVEGALRTNAGIVVTAGADFAPEEDESASLTVDLSCSIKQAESAAQDAFQQSAVHAEKPQTISPRLDDPPTAA